MRLAGPVIFGVVVLAWTAMLALGFGLLYLPHLADELFGDLSAKSDPIRAITMLEGITGTVIAEEEAETPGRAEPDRG